MQRCSGHEEEPPKWRAGLGFAAAQTHIVFDKAVELRELAASATFEQHLSPKLTLSFGVGAVYAGTMVLPDLMRRFDLHGPTASVGLSGLLLEQKGAVPFVMIDGTVSGSAMFTAVDPVYALDLRAGVVAGWSFFGWLTPYVVARVFGGPVFYASYVGGDANHWQLGAGASVRLPKNWDLLLEVVPLGEQRAVVAFGYSY